MASDEYRYFVAVYNCRSFSDAARKMNISSQGIGKSIRGLEGQLGVKLFTRTPQGVKPTEIADELYPSFCRILEEEDHIVELVAASRRAAEKRVLIGRDSRLGDAIGYGVEKYCRAHGMKIELLFTRESEDVQAEKFVEEGYDYRFLSVELDALPELPHSPICMLHYVPAVSEHNPLVAKGTISINDLKGRTVLTESLSYTPMRLLAKMCEEHGFELKLRAVEKTYIWELLRQSSKNITFIRTNEVERYPWNLDDYVTLTMDPPLNTQIVLQTRHDDIDEDLLNCIRESLNARRFND